MPINLQDLLLLTKPEVAFHHFSKHSDVTMKNMLAFDRIISATRPLGTPDLYSDSLTERRAHITHHLATVTIFQAMIPFGFLRAPFHGLLFFFTDLKSPIGMCQSHSFLEMAT